MTATAFSPLAVISRQAEKQVTALGYEIRLTHRRPDQTALNAASGGQIGGWGRLMYAPQSGQ